MKVLHFSILQHYHLRYLLSKKGLLPYKLVDFLNDMTQRQFLESDGATWRFRHRLLQNYFIDKYEVKEGDYEGYLLKGMFYFGNSQNIKAIENFENVLEIESTDFTALFHLALSLIIAGDIKNSEKHSLKIIQLGQKHLGNFNLGHSYLCNGARDKAIECYKLSFDAFKNKTDFFMLMEYCFQHLTQYGITEAYYQSVLEELRKM